jgi:hypothetical protein
MAGDTQRQGVAKKADERNFRTPKRERMETMAFESQTGTIHGPSVQGYNSPPGGTYSGIAPQFAYPAAFGDLLAALLTVAAIPGCSSQRL